MTEPDGIPLKSVQQTFETTLGDTGLPVTRLGLGLAALGRPGYINLGHAEDLQREYSIEGMGAHAHQVLDAAWAAGVRYFDAARSYGRAEAFLGSWLKGREVAHEAVVVGSKWGYTYTADWQVDADVHEVKDHSLGVFERQWGETQAHLGDYLNLYQIHSATLDSGVLEDAEVLSALAQRKSAGVLIGLSLSGSGQADTLARATEIRVDGVRLFDAVQATWNLLETSIGQTLHAVRGEGIGVVVKEALANGRLTARNEDLNFVPVLNRLKAEADRLETTVDAYALAGVLAQPWVDIVLSGAAKLEHLTSNLKALAVPWDEAAAAVAAEIVESPDVYWTTRSQLPWN
jgi:aryl-alcohol dehydrogenase-like predicted oxidoreductase